VTNMHRVILAAGALLAAVMLAPTGFAAESHVDEGARVPTLAALMQREIRWGMSHAEVTDAYNRAMGLFDKEYTPRLARLEPGVEMDQVVAEKDSRKVNFEHSYTVFGDSPTGYDVTALAGEFTYNNDEAIQKLFTDGRTRYFFFIKDRLWKIYDEVPLRAGEGAPLGATFREAVVKLGGLVGARGRARLTDPSHGVDRTTVDWQDGSTHLRAVDRSGEQLVGIVLEDKKTLSNLSALRPHKAADPFAIDPSVTAITKQGVTDPNGRASKSGSDSGRAR
jgi:hypothetical protein